MISRSSRLPLSFILTLFVLLFGLAGTWHLIQSRRADLFASELLRGIASFEDDGEEEAPACDSGQEGPNPLEGPDGPCIGESSGPDPVIDQPFNAITQIPWGQSGSGVLQIDGNPGAPVPMNLSAGSLVSIDPVNRASNFGAVTPSSGSYLPTEHSLGGVGRKLLDHQVGTGSIQGGGALDVLDRFLNQGSVELTHLGLQWGEVDASYRGIQANIDLVIGRVYYSRVTRTGGVGVGGFHSLEEKLVQINADTLAHIHWRQPFLDDAYHYLQLPDGSWTAPAILGTTLATLPKGGYALSFKDGRIHTFDTHLRIVSRADAYGNTTTFEYEDASPKEPGPLAKVIDSRGHVFEVTCDPTTFQILSIQHAAMPAFNLPAKKIVDYEYDTVMTPEGPIPVLQFVKYAERSLYGLPGDSVTAQRTIEYAHDQTTGLLTSMKDHQGVQTMGITYQAGTRKVATMTDGNGGIWTFEVVAGKKSIPTGDEIRVVDPKGYQRLYLQNIQRQVIRYRHYIVSQDSSVVSRAIPPGNPGYYEWQFERNDPNLCNCGLITKVIEPDGGAYEFQYDAKYNLTKRTKISNDGQSSLIWEWAYDPVTHKVSSYTPPESVNGSSVVIYLRAADTDPSNVGGEILTRAIAAMHWRVPYNLSSIWVMRRDSKGRVLEMTGPSANAVGDGAYRYYEYYDQVQGSPAYGLPKLAYTRKDSVGNKVGKMEFEWDPYQIKLTKLTKNPSTPSAAVWLSTYDDEGNRLTLKPPVLGSGGGQQQGEWKWAWDYRNRLGELQRKYYGVAPGTSGGTSTWVRRNYDYDNADNVDKLHYDVKKDAQSLLVRDSVDYDYDKNHNLIRITDADGYVSETTYDERNLQWKVRVGVGTAELAETVIDYRDDGLVRQVVRPFDSRNHATVTELSSYDGFDRPIGSSVSGVGRVALTLDKGGRITMTEQYKTGMKGEVLARRKEYFYEDWHGGVTKLLNHVYNHDASILLRTIESKFLYSPAGYLLQIDVSGSPLSYFEFEADGRCRGSLGRQW